MRLFEIYKQTLRESGSLPGVGAIHISEIPATLEILEKHLGQDLQNHTLGSVGKREFSGDIDLAMDMSREEIPALETKLKKLPEVSDVKLSSVLMTKVRIQNYDPTLKTDRPRTGYVQVDFMFGNTDLLKTYYFSPSEKESSYKGVVRTQMIAVIAALYDREESQKKLPDGRPLETEQYMFSPNKGLVRVRRTPVPRKSGDGYTKQNHNEVIDGPWVKAEDVAQKLNLGGAEALTSYESLSKAIENNYPASLVDKIQSEMESKIQEA